MISPSCFMLPGTCFPRWHLQILCVWLAFGVQLAIGVLAVPHKPPQGSWSLHRGPCTVWSDHTLSGCTQSVFQPLSSGRASGMGHSIPRGARRHLITKQPFGSSCRGARRSILGGINYTQTYLFNLLGMWATKWYFTSHLCNGQPTSRNLSCWLCG